MATADLTVVLDADDSKFRKKLADNLKRGEAFNAAFKKARGGFDPFETAMKAHSEAYKKMEASQKRLETFERRRKISHIELADAIKRRDTAEQSRTKRAIGQYNGLIERTKVRISNLKTETDLYGKILAQRKTMAAAAPAQEKSLFGIPYNAVKSPVTGKTIADPTQEMGALTQAYQDQTAALEQAKKSAGRLEAENHQLRAGQTKLKDSVDKTSDSIQKGRKNTDFWNSSFTKFSVIMSGIAATLFVFQQVTAWIGAAVNKLVVFEQTAAKLSNTLGSSSSADSLFNKIRKTTDFKTAEVGAAATELLSKGYSSRTIEKNLIKAMDYTATGFVDISQAMEIATTDIYDMSEAMDYYSEQYKSSAGGMVADFASKWEHFIEEGAKGINQVVVEPVRKVSGWIDKLEGKLGFRSEEKMTEVMKDLKKKQPLGWGEQKFGGFTLRSSDEIAKMIKSLWSEEKKGSVKRVYPDDLTMAAFEEVFMGTGKEVSKYYERLRLQLENTGQGLRDIFDAMGASEPDKKILEKYLKEKLLDIDWSQIFAREVGITTGQKKGYEDIFKDTGFYSQKLEEYENLEAQRRRGRSIEGLESVYGKGTSSLTDSSRDLESIWYRWLSDLKNIFDKRMKLVSERGKEYFDDTGIMTDEYKGFRLEDNKRKDELRRAAGDPKAEQKYNEDILNFFKDTNQRMFEDQEYMFERMKKVSGDYYEKKKIFIEKESDLLIEAGYDAEAVYQQQLDKMNELNDQYYRTWIQGSKSAWVEYQKHFIDQFDQMKHLVSTSFQAMERSTGDYLFDTLKGQAHSWRDYMIDIFDSITRAWADMIAKMLIQAATSKLFNVLGNLLGGATTGINPSAGGTLTGPGWMAPGNIRMANGGYLGEDVVGIGRRTGSSYELHANEYVIPPNKLSGGGGGVQNTTVNVNITAFDSKDVQRVLSENKGLIGNLVGGQMMRNQSLRTNVKMASR